MDFAPDSPADHQIVYPQALFDYVYHFVGQKGMAWDVATGGGKVARRLSTVFEEVLASDINPRLLESAPALSNVQYVQSDSQQIPLKAQKVDLVTVGQGLHWLPTEAFYEEVRRVTVPGGVVAVWGFLLPKVSMEFDRLVHRLYAETLSPYWPPETIYLQQRYEQLNFPFKNVKETTIDADYYWSYADWVAYLESWTAVRAYWQDHGCSPLDALEPLFRRLWGDRDARKVTFSFFVKLGLVL